MTRDAILTGALAAFSLLALLTGFAVGVLRTRWHLVRIGPARHEYVVVETSWRYRKMRDLTRECRLVALQHGVSAFRYTLVYTRGGEDVEAKLRRTGELPYR